MNFKAEPALNLHCGSMPASPKSVGLWPEELRTRGLLRTVCELLGSDKLTHVGRSVFLNISPGCLLCKGVDSNAEITSN